MRITKLTIKGFRSLRDVEIQLPQICALVGPNNAGKSNLLLAIQRVLGRDWLGTRAFEEEDVYARQPDQDIEIRISVDPPVAYSKFKFGEEAEIATMIFRYTRYKIGAQKGQRRLDQQCLDARGGDVQVLAKAPKKGEKHQYQPLVGVPQAVRVAVPVIFIGTNRSLREHLPGARYSLLRQLFEDVARGLEQPETTEVPKGGAEAKAATSRAAQFRTLMAQALEVLRTEDFKKLEMSIKRNALTQLGFDPDTDVDKLDFFFAPFEPMDFYKALDLRVKEYGLDLSATELGEGFQNAIVLAILKAFEERRKSGAVLLIEEPEMFLHPQMQRSLYRTLREIGRTNQVIYTTHSPHFVSVPNYEEVVLVRRGPKGTMTRRSSLPIDEKRREKLIKELDPERNELFFASRLLLVEGDTEKLALPEYAKRLKLDLDKAGATIVEVGGKRNLPEFIKVAASFGIPTGVLYDEDSSEFEKKRDEEAAFNADLDAFGRPDGSTRTWRLSKKYEDHLRRANGDKKYELLCQRYPQVSKPSRARLIASDSESAIPEPIEEVLTWLAGT